MQRAKGATKKPAKASVADKVRKRATKALDNVTKRADKLRNKLTKRAEDTADETVRRAMKLALSVIDFQKTTFDSAFKLIDQLQEQSEKLVQDLATNADWLPDEGKQVVKEWVRMLRHGRAEFRKTVDKSFDLVTDYFERVNKPGGTAKKAAPKKAAAKKKPAKKRAAGRKKAASAAAAAPTM